MALDDTLELTHGTLTGEEGPRLCACGCGEPLKEDAKRAFIHGHKQRMLEDRIEDDPEPGDEAKVKATIRVTARIKKEMQESIEAYLAMAAGIWGARDPICGGTLVQASPDIAEKLVPILARNQMFVRYFRSSSSFKEGMDLFIVLYPVLQTILAHHVFHTVELARNGEPVQQVDYSNYAA